MSLKNEGEAPSLDVQETEAAAEPARAPSVDELADPLIDHVPAALQQLARLRDASAALRRATEELLALLVLFREEDCDNGDTVGSRRRITQIAIRWGRVEALVSMVAQLSQGAGELKWGWVERRSDSIASGLGDEPFLSLQEIATILDGAGLYRSDALVLSEHVDADPDEVADPYLRDLLARAIAGPQGDDSAETAAESRGELEGLLDGVQLAALDDHLDAIHLYGNLREDATARAFYQLGCIEGTARVLYPGLPLRQILRDAEKTTAIVAATGLGASLAELAVRIVLSERTRPTTH